MNAVERMEIEWACEKLGRLYALCSDSNDLEALTYLFTQDAVFFRPILPDVEIKGRTEILTAFKLRAPIIVQHQVSTCVIDVHSTSTASGISYISFLLAPGIDQPLPRIGGAQHFAEFRDSYVLTAEAWKFSVRRRRLLLKSA
jgi:hypothetical protein